MTEETNHQFLHQIDVYIQQLFVLPDEALEQGLRDAAAAGLPAIQVSPNEGKLLHLLTRIAGARRILEIGTLGGYSTVWLARALPPGGVLVTLELEAKHAAVARRNLERCGVGDRVEIRVGPAADSLRALIGAGEAPFDLVFIDADKPGYLAYLELALQLSRPGTVILADNLVRAGRILEEAPAEAADRAIRAFNAALAAHPRLDSLIVPLYRNKVDGLSISIVR
jgi:predicted O-methyltransferase YrrM